MQKSLTSFFLKTCHSDEKYNTEKARVLKEVLVKALREIQTAYEDLLGKCRDLLCEAFSIQEEKNSMRKILRIRSSYLLDKCVEHSLKSFILAVTNDVEDEHKWLEAIITVITDKPAKSWTDNDFVKFEIKLSSIARRFKNLEALQENITSLPNNGFDARRITVTQADGNEVHQIVWLERKAKKKADEIAQKILENGMGENKNLQEAVVAALIEKVLAQKDIKINPNIKGK